MFGRVQGIARRCFLWSRKCFEHYVKIISLSLHSEAERQRIGLTRLSVMDNHIYHHILSLHMSSCQDLKTSQSATKAAMSPFTLHQKSDFINCFHRLTPQLTGVREETRNNNYSLVLEFKVKKDMTEKMWTDRQSKIQTFFGPGVSADIEFPTEQEVHVYLTTDGRWAVSRILQKLLTFFSPHLI